MRTSSVKTFAVVASMITILAIPAPLAKAKTANNRNAPEVRASLRSPAERALEILRQMLRHFGSVGVHGLPSIPIPEPPPSEPTTPPEGTVLDGLPSIPIPSDNA